MGRFNLKYNQIILIFLFAKFFIHFYTNAFAGYGIFRDELYLYACTLRPDFGYVDQPPLSIWILSIITGVFGKSVFAMRTFAALFGALAIIPLAKTVKHLGGDSIALTVTLTAFLISPIYLAYCAYYSMNSIDMLLWNTAIYLVIKLKISGNPRYWTALGLIMGLALLNKIGMLWFGAGFALALILTKDRRWFSTKWPYIAAGIALVMFLPYIIWNAIHNWPTVEFLAGATDKYQSQNAFTFLTGQLLINNPMNILVWLAGLLYFTMLDKERKGIQLLIIFLVVMGILLFFGHAKPEYLSQIFVVLFIGGGLAIAHFSASRKWIAPMVIVIQFSGLLLSPFTLPILPVEKYISYSRAIGIGPTTSEGHQLEELPQFFADMFGWEEQARAVAEVYHSLTDEEKLVCAIFGDNYGRSGAIDYFADKYDLPLSIGNHNNYWIWGPGEYDGKLLITVSNNIGDKPDHFEQVEEMGVVSSRYVMPYENNLKVFVCRNLKATPNEIWSAIKSYN